MCLQKQQEHQQAMRQTVQKKDSRPVKKTLHNNHDGFVVLALQATKSDVISSTTFFVPPISPSKVNAMCPGILPPILELASGSKLLDDITVEDCSEDEALVEALMEEEHLDFSFYDDDCDGSLKSTPLCPPPANLTPPPTPSGGCPHITTIVVGNSLSSTPGNSAYRDLFSTSRPIASYLCEDLQHFVEVFLSSSPILHQKVVYESLPKFCNFYNVLGHTWLLCSKAAISTNNIASTQAMQAGKKRVFSKLGPQIHQHEQATPTSTQEQSQPLVVQVPPAASSNTPIVATR
ncbi:hypothetical protein Peur_021334 [Populus x canadensis]